MMLRDTNWTLDERYFFGCDDSAILEALNLQGDKAVDSSDA